MYELQGKVAAVTGAASGIGLASTEAMISAGATVVLVDRDAGALEAVCARLGDAAIPLVIDLSTRELRVAAAGGAGEGRPASTSCTPMPEPTSAAISSKPSHDAIDRMLNLNVNAVMKNVRTSFRT